MTLASKLLEGYGYNSDSSSINDPIGYMNEACIECINSLYEASQQFYTGDIIGQTQVLMEGADANKKMKELWEGFKKKVTSLLDKFIAKFKKVVSFFKKKSKENSNDVKDISEKLSSMNNSESVSILDMMNEFISFDNKYNDLQDKMLSDSIWSIVCASDVVGNIGDVLSSKSEGRGINLHDINNENWRDIFEEENGGSFNSYMSELQYEAESLRKINKYKEMDVPTLQKIVNKAGTLIDADNKVIKHLDNAIDVLTRWKKDLADPIFLSTCDDNSIETFAINMLQKRVTTSLDYYNQTMAVCNIHYDSVNMLLAQIRIGLNNLKK